MWCGLLVRVPGPPGNLKATGSTRRIEICPPAVRRPRPGWRERLLDWLAGGVPEEQGIDDAEDDGPVPAGAMPLDAVQEDFLRAVDDVTAVHYTDLIERIQESRSLRALWHLRTEVFNVVSRDRGQGEATARLQRLNRHFPARVPRRGFGSVDGTQLERSR
jgi:hypothetical protein